MASTRHAALALLLACAGTAANATSNAADSVADFSNVQGQGGWWYGYYSGTLAPAGFTLLPTYDSASQSWIESSGGQFYWTQIYAAGAHPQGTTTSGGRVPVEQWAVRRWTAADSGSYLVSFSVAKDGSRTALFGNGVTGHVFANGAEVFSQWIAPSDTVGASGSVTVALAAGQSVDFALDPYQGDDRYDSTLFKATVSAVPEPATAALWLLGVAGWGLARRRRSGLSVAG